MSLVKFETLEKKLFVINKKLVLLDKDIAIFII